MPKSLIPRALAAVAIAGAAIAATPALAGADVAPLAGGGCATYRTNHVYPLRQCDKGPAVAMVQRALRVVEPNLVIDGYFGARTQAALVEYQQSWGLTVDSIVNAYTWSSLTWQYVGGIEDADNSGRVDPWEVAGVPPPPNPPTPPEPPTPPAPQPACAGYRADYAYPIQLCGRGEGVRFAQRGLLVVAPDLVVDGYFGPNTLAALQQFQRHFGLPVTGEIDEPTWIALTWRFVWDHGRDVDGDGVLDPWEIGA